MYFHDDYLYIMKELKGDRPIELIGDYELPSDVYKDYCAVGPKQGTISAWGSNAKTILCRSNFNVKAIERFRLIKIMDDDLFKYDPLTEEVYELCQLHDFFKTSLVIEKP